jgi:predicted ArsR family transcriptional regulator
VTAEGRTVEQISEAVELHPNTVRVHLEVLVASGAVVRASEESLRRGRPRQLFRRVGIQDSPFKALATALAAQLTTAQSEELAYQAAETWTHALEPIPKAENIDDAVAFATQALNRLGFDATTSAIGDAISVRSCPYAQMVEEHPVICDIHAALVGRVLRETGQPVALESMEVWTRPGQCVARLHRADFGPSRTILGNHGNTTQSKEGER